MALSICRLRGSCRRAIGQGGPEDHNLDLARGVTLAIE